MSKNQAMPRVARALTILAFALGLLGLGARTAAAKPKVSVLGLEVGGTIDTAATGVAHDVTEGLRTKAKQGGGPFVYAPNSDRELIDEKVLKNCDSEGPLCMSDIGKDMGTDVLIYGQLVKQGDSYKATLHVLDVRKKARMKDLDVTVPGGSSSDAVRSIAKKAYNDLVGGGEEAAPPSGGTGTLVVSANVDGGTVFVDDEQKDALSGGKVTLTLPEGRYRVAVESPGHRRKEKSVKVAAGDAVLEQFDLAESGGGGGGGTRSNPWKPVFFVTAGVAVALGGYSLYEWSQELSEEGLITAVHNDPRAPPLTNDDCGTTDLKNGDPGNHFHAACDHYKKHLYTGIIAGLVGAGALGFGYVAFFYHPTGESRASASATPKKKPAGRSLAVVPSFDAESGGAMVFGTW